MNRTLLALLLVACLVPALVQQVTPVRATTYEYFSYYTQDGSMVFGGLTLHYYDGGGSLHIVALTTTPTQYSVYPGLTWSIAEGQGPIGDTVDDGQTYWYSQGPVSGSQSSSPVNVEYYHDSNIFLIPNLIGGGSPGYWDTWYYAQGTYTEVQLPTGGLFHVDIGTTVAFPVLSSNSGASEQWIATTYTFTAGTSDIWCTYQNQYYVTVSSAHDSPTGAGWYNSGATATIGVTTPSGGNLFASWTGSAGGYSGVNNPATFSVGQAITETANWNAQTVSITITSSQTGSGFIVVDGVAQTAPYTVTWNVGDSHTISANSPVSGATGTRYVYASWSDAGAQSHSITVPSSPTTYTVTYTTQYYLTVTSSHGSPTGTGWYNSGASASFSVTSPVSGGAGTQYVNTGWSGDATSSPVTMNGPKTVTATWVTQYYLTVTSGYGSPQGAGWYNASLSASFNVTTPYSTGSGTRQAFQAWTGSGTGNYTGGTDDESVTMGNPITEAASWYSQLAFNLSISITGGGSPTVTLTATQAGSPYTPSLNGTSTPYWLDSGTSWSVPAIIAGGAGNSGTAPARLSRARHRLPRPTPLPTITNTT